MKRERNFKVYLNNPSMRAALFAPVKPDETDRIGHLAESAIFSQWQHSKEMRRLRYARWKAGGEVDVVYLGGNEKPQWIGEIKWSDRIDNHFGQETAAMEVLLGKHKTINTAFFTTKTISREVDLMNRRLHLRPTAFYCYIVGRNITSRLEEIVGEVVGKAA